METTPEKFDRLLNKFYECVWRYANQYSRRDDILDDVLLKNKEEMCKAREEIVSFFEESIDIK